MDQEQGGAVALVEGVKPVAADAEEVARKCVELAPGVHPGQKSRRAGREVAGSVHEAGIVLPGAGLVAGVGGGVERGGGLDVDVLGGGIPEDELFALVAAEVRGDSVVKRHPVDVAPVRGRQAGERLAPIAGKVP